MLLIVTHAKHKDIERLYVKEWKMICCANTNQNRLVVAVVEEDLPWANTHANLPLLRMWVATTTWPPLSRVDPCPGMEPRLLKQSTPNLTTRPLGLPHKILFLTIFFLNLGVKLLLQGAVRWCLSQSFMSPWLMLEPLGLQTPQFENTSDI